MSTRTFENGLVLHMHRGPFQNNGASAWYSPLRLGTPGQTLKMAIDTGTNITWATSTLCPPDQCQHYSADRFDCQRSCTFAFTDCLQHPYSFGPWGAMQVEAGSDVLTLPGTAPLGLTDLVLVGSLIMEHCYTVHEYQVVHCKPQTFSLAPVGIWLFNRPGGPQIITRASKKAFTPGQRTVTTQRVTLAPPRLTTPVLRQGSVAGTWTNDYGSLMTLSVRGQQVSGFYQSSTGSIGMYEVTGYQLEAAATPGMGQPVALAIEWHSVGNDPADPSWNWSSGLYGQISLEGTEEVLTLSHLLVASSDFPELANTGTYADKLVYRRSAAGHHAAITPPPAVPALFRDRLAGTWRACEGTCLKLHIEAASEGRFGRVHGSLIHASDAWQVSGFTDINAAASGLTHQSLAITAAHKNDLLTLSGTLQLKGDVLELIMMTGVATPPARAYLQTRISALTFKRGG